VAGLALTNARLRSSHRDFKHEILDFYVRHGLSVAGPTVRLRQLRLSASTASSARTRARIATARGG